MKGQQATTRLRRLLLVLASVLLGIAIAAPAAATRSDERGSAPKTEPSSVMDFTTAIAVSAVDAPRHATGSDGQEHIAYDLLMTNAMPADVTLLSVEVLTADGDTLLLLEGEALAASTHLMSTSPPTATIPPSATVTTMINLTVATNSVRRSVTHRIRYALAPDTPSVFRALVANDEVTGPELRVKRQKPIVIAPPMRGPGWTNASGCCDPSTLHRQFLLPANGQWVKPETFAIDWVQLRDGRLFEGDGTEVTQYPSYGEPLFAVANATVVAAVDGHPDIAPGAEPILAKPADLAGNHVILRIRPDVYALYAHMIPGSVNVEVGDRVRTGDQLGLLGNTGNTTAPHLHFGLTDGPAPLSSNSLPFEIDRFRLQGVVTGEGDEPGELIVSETPREVRRAYPLALSVVEFG